MEIRKLLTDVVTKQLIGSTENNIDKVCIDSRQIDTNSMFVAIKGTQTDGHQYIDQALQKGATAIVCETLPTELKPEITYIQVTHSEDSLGQIASNFYRSPSSKLKLVGITGTNGKTTVATILYETFRKLGYKVGLISTVCNYVDTTEVPADHTTPDIITTNQLLVEMVDAGCEYAFMEVSSHAVDQKRIANLTFEGGIFTNLTRDHLDYHKTVANYLKAKKTFFDNLPNTAFSLVNTDDKNGLVMQQNTKAKTYTYSLRSMADFKAKILELHFNGMDLEIDNKEVIMQLTGRFNASNLLAVYGAAVLLKQDPDEVLIAMSSLKPVTGRFQTLTSPSGYTVIVDYAHTPDALVNVLTTIHDILNNDGAVITVVGAGGNRDKGKRPLMAQESVKHSDRVIITSDNPRFEKPQDIIADMLEGLTNAEKNSVLAIESRRDAIKTACMLAKPGDVILIAGKGHETYQDIEGIKHHFDDREEVYNIFKTQNN